MNNIVIKIGGSLLFSKNLALNIESIKEFCEILKNNRNFDSIIIVCGGGALARRYIDVIRKFGSNESSCDTFGIDISRLNAKLIIEVLGPRAYPVVPKTIEELSIALLHQKIVVMGGLQPGQSTTSVALEVAEFSNAEQIVILTDVKGIYDKDPNKFKDAKFLHHITPDQLQHLILSNSNENQAAAGEYRIFDAVSLQIIKRSKIKIIVMIGTPLSEFKKFCNKESKIDATIISIDQPIL